MSFHGMDLDAVVQHASMLEHQAANEVLSVLGSVSATVTQLMTVWHGEDARRFEQEWEMHRNQLSLLHDSLSGLVSALNHSIAQQRDASGA